MDTITKFELELDKEVYYAGETLSGRVVVHNTENIKVQGKTTLSVRRAFRNLLGKTI